jgi:hypothetical protein
MVSHQTKALAYAERGWSVLPLHEMGYAGCSCGSPSCKSPGKHPRLAHGLRDASRDPADIRVWFNRWPQSNIGVRTGSDSGFWVLDIDPRNGGDDSLEDLILEYGELPETLMAHTGGGGRHFFFRIPPGGIKCGKLADGIDIKGEGGYIVAPPSNHASGGVYRWHFPDAEILDAPDWLLLKPRQVASPIPSLGADQPLGNPGKAEEIRAALGCVPADSRKEWLYIGMALHNSVEILGEASAFNLWTEWSKRSDKYDAADQNRVWASFDDAGGVTLSTLFAIAKGYGFQVNAPKAEPPADIQKIESVELVDPTEDGVVEMPDLLLHPHGVLHELVDWIDETSIRPQRPFAVASALTILGTILGRRYSTESGLRTNLYLVGVGPTGCGKNHARTAAKKVLQACDMENRLGGEELASGQAIISRVAISPSVLFQLDEFGMLMAAVQNPNAGTHLVAILSNLMKLFSSAGDTYIGTEYADQEKRPRVEIECPCVSVYGTTTPETFYKALGSGHVVSGYLNRLLVVETSINRPKRQRPIRSEVPESIKFWAKAATCPPSGEQNLVGLNPKTPVVVPMSRGAEELFDALDLEIDRLMERDRGSGLDALHNRTWEHAAKIALILSLSRKLDRPVINVEDAEWAITFVKWSQSRMIHEVQLRVADSPFQAKVKECQLALIKAGGRGLTERDMGRVAAFARLVPRERASILDALQIAGQAAKVEIRTKGRPRVAWVATK